LKDEKRRKRRHTGVQINEILAQVLTIAKAEAFFSFV
jgi:hypothetical protein